jgi:peptide/nickel transport system ATP-binding protein
VTQSGDALRAPSVSHVFAEHPERTQAAPLLEVSGLTRHFPLPKSGFLDQPRVLRALDDVDLVVRTGETVGLVGESGSGKSTLARLVMRLDTPTAGTIRFAGQDIGSSGQAAIRPLRRRLQMIFQDPYASLNPRMTVRQILEGPILLHRLAPDTAALRRRVTELLDLVGLPSAAMERYPHEFSGGQRQRISIARALAVEPDFIVGDEPISALDVNIQAQILNLMIGLQERLGLTYLFIAHDLAVVRHISDRIYVLYLGKVMEMAPAEVLFVRPLHPYTNTLISAVPVPEVGKARRRIMLSGEVPSAVDPPSGCRFRTRCPAAAPRCAAEPPPLTEVEPRHFVACHFPGAVTIPHCGG